jgi:hypothetical protein
MIVVDINENQTGRAKTRLYIKRNEKTISNDVEQANFIGSLGEIIVFDYFNELGHKIQDFSCKDFDLIIDSYKIEIKTKKSRGIPQPSWLCLIAEKYMYQNPDFYFFCTINLEHKKGYIFGYISKANFLKLSKFQEKGNRDGNTNFYFKENNYVLAFEHLHKFTDKNAM